MSHNLQKTHRAKVQAAKAPIPRYEVRWSNGEWGIFDTFDYKMVERVRPNLHRVAVEVLNG